MYLNMVGIVLAEIVIKYINIEETFVYDVIVYNCMVYVGVCSCECNCRWQLKCCLRIYLHVIVMEDGFISKINTESF